MKTSSEWRRTIRVKSKSISTDPIRTRQFLRRSLRMVVFASFGLCLAALIPFTGRAQGALTNGWANTGAISTAGETDTWTIAANPGDRIAVQISKLSGGAGFTPRIELFVPDGFSLGLKSSGA